MPLVDFRRLRNRCVSLGLLQLLGRSQHQVLCGVLLALGTFLFDRYTVNQHKKIAAQKIHKKINHFI